MECVLAVHCTGKHEKWLNITETYIDEAEVRHSIEARAAVVVQVLKSHKLNWGDRVE